MGREEQWGRDQAKLALFVHCGLWERGTWAFAIRSPGFSVCELFRNKMREGLEGVWTCVDRVGAPSPQEGSADKESRGCDRCCSGHWENCSKGFKTVIAFESSILLMRKLRK